MNEALTKQLARLRTRFAKTPLPRFFAWWGQELAACLPQRWRALLAERAEALLLSVENCELIVWRERGQAISEWGRISLDLPAETQVAELQQLRFKIDDPDLRVIYCLAPERVLRRTMNLPAAAEENLRQVLTFEMDRQTPFKADQVYFDSRILERNAATRQNRIELVVMPRTQMDAELAAVGGGSLVFHAVDCWDAMPGGAHGDLNLLPPERRARRQNLSLPINLGLAALVIVLLVINMGESLANRAAMVEAMRAEVEKSNVEAKQIASLKKTLQESTNGANFLSEKKRNAPVMIALIDDITKRLPDDTYLERLNIEGGQVKLQGQSKEAAKLIGLLEPSPFLAGPAFEGQIQPDPRTSKERFQIIATLQHAVDGQFQAANTDATQSDMANSGPAEPQSANADAAKSDAAKPWVAKPEVAKPWVAKSEVEKPDPGTVEAAKAEVAKAEAAKTEAAKIQAEKAEAAKARAAKTEAARAQAAKVEAAKAEAAKAEAARVQAQQSQAVQRAATQPQTTVPQSSPSTSQPQGTTPTGVPTSVPSDDDGPCVAKPRWMKRRKMSPPVFSATSEAPHGV